MLEGTTTFKKYCLGAPQVGYGENSLQMCKVAVGVMTKQSWTSDKGWPSSL